jgi:type IV pilus assembly protein PilC
MATFKYQALNETGTTVSGTIEADTQAKASELLSARGVIPVKVMKAGTGGFSIKELEAKMSSVKVPELILFSKQFRTLINAGISILNILELMEHQTSNPKLKKTVAEIAQDIREGTNLYNAFSKHKGVFSELYCSMLRAGEISGTLPEILDRLIYIIEHEYKVKKSIVSALTYPCIVVVFLFVAFIVLLTFVIPVFAGIFEEAGVELPMPTRVCIFLYKQLDANWPYLLVGLFVMLVALFFLAKTEKGRLIKDKLILELPLLGIIFKKAAISRFASIFSILQASGVTVLETLNIVSATIGNAAMSREFDGLKSKLEEGQGISGPLRSSKYFTPMVINMIAIGEESGNLDDMLREVADHYDYEVEYSIGRLSEMIGPILIAGLAGMVGFFAAAIYLPLADMSKAMMKTM